MNLNTKHFQNQFKSKKLRFQIISRFVICAIIIMCFNVTATSQEKYTQPSWWFGVAGGANFNSYGGSFRNINQDIMLTYPFEHGFGVGGFVAPLLEYHRPNSIWGFMLQQGVDNRRAEFQQTDKQLFARISYFTVEPSIRISPFRSNFYLYAGPRLGLLWSTSFKYKRAGFNDHPNEADPNSEAYIRSLKKNLVTMQVGAGYDIPVTSKSTRTQVMISPFVSFHPSLGQNLRTIESLTLNTLRAGIALKVGMGRKIPPPSLPPMPVVLDRDGDGVLDGVDRCPDVAGLASLQGCPDRDGDGIADMDDKCPDVAGVARYQGCPIPDGDNDGINDELDKCPAVPGLARYQGCPIPDTDGDGVNDEEDKCINDKGPASNFGCPIISMEILKRVKIAAENIFFETAKSTLLAKSFPKLNDVVTILKENPTFMVQVDGHTDFVGKDDYNQTLSEQRAASVKTYLVSQGIAESRLSSAGYGETRPVADNNTTAGKAKNRRVEMTLRNY